MYKDIYISFINIYISLLGGGWRCVGLVGNKDLSIFPNFNLSAGSANEGARHDPCC
jgi:hypothetical protein